MQHEGLETADLQKETFVSVKSRRGKKQSLAPGSGGETTEETETDQPLCPRCSGSTL